MILCFLKLTNCCNLFLAANVTVSLHDGSSICVPTRNIGGLSRATALICLIQYFGLDAFKFTVLNVTI